MNSHLKNHPTGRFPLKGAHFTTEQRAAGINYKFTPRAKQLNTAINTVGESVLPSGGLNKHLFSQFSAKHMEHVFLPG